MPPKSGEEFEKGEEFKHSGVSPRVHRRLPNSKQKLNCALHAFISEARPGLSTFAGVVTHVHLLRREAELAFDLSLSAKRPKTWREAVITP